MPLLEIESKFRVDSHQPFAELLKKWGATRVGFEEHADHYFNGHDRDFRQTDEAFRIRRIGEKNFLTYKGPKRGTLTKTRPEIEIPFADGPNVATDMESLLTHLGYRPVTVVKKRREIYELHRDGQHLHICLDTAEEVGTFVEVEIVAEESKFETAQATLLKIAAELGLTQPERRSYLGLLLESRGGT